MELRGKSLHKDMKVSLLKTGKSFMRGCPDCCSICLNFHLLCRETPYSEISMCVNLDKIMLKLLSVDNLKVLRRGGR